MSTLFIQYFKDKNAKSIADYQSNLFGYQIAKKCLTELTPDQVIEEVKNQI